MIHISKRAMKKFNEAQPGGPQKQSVEQRIPTVPFRARRLLICGQAVFR